MTVQERLQILLSFLQINGSLNISFDVPWPGEFEAFIDFSKLANLEISGLSNFVNPCLYVVDYITQYYLAMALLPAIAIVTCLMYFVTVRCCRLYDKNHIKDEENVAY